MVAVDNAWRARRLCRSSGLEPDEGTARLITLIICYPGSATIASTRIVGMLNAGGVEVAIVGVLVIALLVAVATTGLGSTDNLTSRGVTAGDADYLGSVVG